MTFGFMIPGILTSCTGSSVDYYHDFLGIKCSFGIELPPKRVNSTFPGLKGFLAKESFITKTVSDLEVMLRILAENINMCTLS